MYENKQKYKDFNFSSSRAIAYYVNINDINNLLDYSALGNIYKDYREYLKNKKIQINELTILSDSDSDNFKYEKTINNNLDYSSNAISDSECSSSEIVNFDSDNSSNSGQNNDSDNEDNNSNHNKKNKNTNNELSKNKSKKNNKKDKKYSGKNKSHKANQFESNLYNIKIIKFYKEDNKSNIFNKYSSIFKTNDSFIEVSDYDLSKKNIEDVFQKRIKNFCLGINDISSDYYINELIKKKIAIRKKYIINRFNIRRNIIRFPLNYVK